MLTFPRADLMPSESGEGGGETACWVVGYAASLPYAAVCGLRSAVCGIMYAMHEKEDRSRRSQKANGGEWSGGIGRD